ncbi:MAG TPA: TylF/MycF/NovP-related O-methyltransferase [Candidatus Limnocylindria bacterium]|nr:TylF/MycF/NovP-related O-methyltransferase [Candidatus Limnocylindria bacterium]
MGSKLLVKSSSTKLLHVYDSFAGLPEKTRQDQSPAGHQFKEGELYARKATLVQHFRQASLPPPIIHKAWFRDLTSADVPAHIAFAFLDGDFYESIRDSLHLVEDKLVPGSRIIVDDYQSEALPGAAKAVDEWLKNTLPSYGSRPVWLSFLYSSNKFNCGLFSCFLYYTVA